MSLSFNLCVYSKILDASSVFSLNTNQCILINAHFGDDKFENAENMTIMLCRVQALSASDLSLVIYVCRTMDPASVFSESPCQLSQPVLLSLIQQLSANFDTDVELKHRSGSQHTHRKHLSTWFSGLDQRSCSTSGPASTWMGEHLQAG